MYCNGPAFMAQFLDSKTRMRTTYLLDQSGNTTKKTSKTLTELQLFFDGATLAVPDKGFINYLPGENDVRGKATFTPTLKGAGSWSFSAPPVSGSRINNVSPLLFHNNTVLNLVMRKKKLKSKDAEFSIIAIGANNGKKIFEQKFVSEDYTVEPMNAYATSETTYRIFGQYFRKKDDVLTDQSRGLYTAEIDNKGKLISEKYISWGDDVGKVVTVNAKGKIEGLGYMLIHRIIQASDGKIFVVGESYKKTVDAVGVIGNIGMALLGGATAGSGVTVSSDMGMMQLTINDLVIMQFSSDFTCEKLSVYDKEKTRFPLPQGALYAGNRAMATLIEQMGFFDYNFTQYTADKTAFTICYQDWITEGKNRWMFGTITYSEGKFNHEKIDMDSEESVLSISRAKPGFLLVNEYNKKEKKVSLRLEKINY